MLPAPFGVPGRRQILGAPEFPAPASDEATEPGTFPLRGTAIGPDGIVQILAVADRVGGPVGGVPLLLQVLAFGGPYLGHSPQGTLRAVAGVELKAGAYVDFISPNEMREELGRLAGLVQDMLRQEAGETVTFSAVPFLTSSAGKGSGTVYRIPAGFEGYLTRLIVTWPTASAKTGGTKCTLLICADAISASTTRAINTLAPSAFTASRSHAPLFRGGQQIIVSLTTGPHTKTIFCSGQVVLVKLKTTHSDTLESGGNGT